MTDIRLITLSSAMASQDTAFRDEASAFLKSFDPDHRLNFVEGGDAFPLFLIGSGGSEAYFKDIYQRYPGPYFILPLGNRNSFAASLEIQSFLASKGLRSVFINKFDKSVIDRLVAFGEAYSLKKKIQGKRLALIGGPSDWLIASKCDPKAVKEKFGVEIVKIPMKELEKEIEKRKIDDEADFHMMRRKTRREETLRGSFYIHSALLALKKKYRLDGFTLRCFDLLKKYQNTSCLAFGLLNDSLFTAACEGDVPSLLTMFLIQELTGKPSFMANPERIDIEKREALYAHCTCPFSMGKSFSLLTHYESGMGFGIRLKLNEKPITMVKISPRLDRVVCKRGKIISNPEEEDICRTQIVTKFDEDITDCLTNPAGNHMIFTYADVKDVLSAFFAML